MQAYRTKTGIKRKRERAILLSIYIVCGVLLFATLVLWFILRSGAFRIERIEIQGAERITEDEIMTFLRSQVPASSLSRPLTARNILAWPKGFSEDALRLLPEASAVSVSKDFTSRVVTAQVTEREREGIWCVEQGEENTKCLWFDGGGRAFGRTVGGEGNLIPVVHDRTGRKVGIGSNVLEGEELPNFLSILEVLKRMSLSIREVRIESLELGDVEVATHEGPFFYFSLRFPAWNALAGLEEIKRETDLTVIEYADFRIENRVYYK